MVKIGNDEKGLFLNPQAVISVTYKDIPKLTDQSPKLYRYEIYCTTCKFDLEMSMEPEEVLRRLNGNAEEKKQA